MIWHAYRKALEFKRPHGNQQQVTIVRNDALCCFWWVMRVAAQHAYKCYAIDLLPKIDVRNQIEASANKQNNWLNFALRLIWFWWKRKSWKCWWSNTFLAQFVKQSYHKIVGPSKIISYMTRGQIKKAHKNPHGISPLKQGQKHRWFTFLIKWLRARAY